MTMHPFQAASNGWVTETEAKNEIAGATEATTLEKADAVNPSNAESPLNQPPVKTSTNNQFYGIDFCAGG